MTFEEFVQLALVIDEHCMISEDEDGYLQVNTYWRSVGDDTVPLVYDI